MRLTKRQAALLGGGLGIAVLVAGGFAATLVLSVKHSDTVSAGAAIVSTASATASSSVSAADSNATPTPIPTETTTYNETPTDGSTTADYSGQSAAVQAEMAYVLTYWNSPNDSVYGFFDDEDCANFASQALLARGFEQDSDWWTDADGDAADSSVAWRSSTALHDYLAEHPELATALTDDQRSEVRVGDIVQFDWDNSGDRDHTGIVTRIDTDASGHITIYYAAHTDNTLVRSVDWAINVLHPGGTAYYWHLSS